MISFACFAPHPPIILPSVGSNSDREKVKATIKSLELLRKDLEKSHSERIIISSPHPDWGFDVPLFFLAKNFKGVIQKILIGLDEPKDYFDLGKRIYKEEIKPLKEKIALIASGDMSHVLRDDGPYGFHPDGPKFDEEFIQALKRKDIGKILELNKIYPQAGECGLRSFAFVLGILEGGEINWQAKILSYEFPFGVGYLVARLV